jgi:hypothetical protein
MPLPHPLNGAGVGSIIPQPRPQVGGTQGGMALTETNDLSFPVGTQTIVWSLRPSVMIRKCLTHRRQRVVSEFVEVTVRDPKRERDVGRPLAPEHSHDRLQPAILF